MFVHPMSQVTSRPSTLAPVHSSMARENARAVLYLLLGVVRKKPVRRHRRDAVRVQRLDPLERVRSRARIEEPPPARHRRERGIVPRRCALIVGYLRKRKQVKRNNHGQWPLKSRSVETPHMPRNKPLNVDCHCAMWSVVTTSPHGWCRWIQSRRGSGAFEPAKHGRRCFTQC